jgi:beta-glucanase (GH16 family)
MSDFYIFYGTVEAVLKASAGKGMVSSLFLISPTLDESK